MVQNGECKGTTISGADGTAIGTGSQIGRMRFLIIKIRTLLQHEQRKNYL